MYSEKNLFTVLSKWANRQRQGENFCTDALVWMINHLLINENEIGRRILSRICSGEPDSDYIAEGKGKIEVRTQEIIEEGRPDIVIESLALLAIVEVKVDAPLEKTQLHRYKAYIDNKKEGRAGRLILLERGGTNLTEDEKELLDNSIKWAEIADWLKTEDPEDSFSSGIIDQFHQFVRCLQVSVERDRSVLSKELMEYLEKEGDQSIFLSRMNKTTKPIDSEPRLKEFSSLIHLIEKAAENIEDWDTFIFDSSTTEGWVQWNANELLYTFQVHLKNPEVIRFQRFRHDSGVADIHLDMSCRNEGDQEGKFIKYKGNWDGWWEAKLDLVKEYPDFFSDPVDKDKQVGILESFFRKSLEYADTTWGKGR